MNNSYASFVIQKVCKEVEKSERAVEKLQEEIKQLKEQKKHSEEKESKISIALYMGQLQTTNLGLSADFKQKGFSLTVCLHTNCCKVAVVTLFLYLFDQFCSSSHCGSITLHKVVFFNTILYKPQIRFIIFN